MQLLVPLHLLHYSFKEVDLQWLADSVVEAGGNAILLRFGIEHSCRAGNHDWLALIEI